MPPALLDPVSYLSPSSAETDGRAMSASCVLATTARDRQGDVLEVAGLDLGNHKALPVVLLDHGRYHPLPIGKTVTPNGTYTVRIDREAGEVRQTTYFLKGLMAEQVFALVEEGVMGCSIGFRPIERERLPIDVENGYLLNQNGSAGSRILRSELVEVSWTALPVNPEAVRKALHGTYVGKSLAEPIALALTPLAGPKRAWAKSNWDESKHPRADDGKFGHGGGGAKEPAAERPAPAAEGGDAEDDDPELAAFERRQEEDEQRQAERDKWQAEYDEESEAIAAKREQEDEDLQAEIDAEESRRGEWDEAHVERVSARQDDFSERRERQTDGILAAREDVADRLERGEVTAEEADALLEAIAERNDAEEAELDQAEAEAEAAEDEAAEKEEARRARWDEKYEAKRGRLDARREKEDARRERALEKQRERWEAEDEALEAARDREDEASGWKAMGTDLLWAKSSAHTGGTEGEMDGEPKQLPASAALMKRLHDGIKKAAKGAAGELGMVEHEQAKKVMAGVLKETERACRGMGKAWKKLYKGLEDAAPDWDADDQDQAAEDAEAVRPEGKAGDPGDEQPEEEAPKPAEPDSEGGEVGSAADMETSKPDDDAPADESEEDVKKLKSLTSELKALMAMIG